MFNVKELGNYILNRAQSQHERRLSRVQLDELGVHAIELDVQ